MSDNVVINPIPSNEQVGADDIGGVKFQRIKLIYGADGENKGDVSGSNPLPVLGGNIGAETPHDENTAAGTDEILRTVASGYKFVVTSVVVLVANSCSVDVAVTLEFDGASSDTVIVKHPGIAPGSGFVWGDGTGILAIGSNAEDLIWTNSVPTDGSVTISVTGYLLEI